MALGKPAIIRFASVRPLLFRRSIIPRRRLSSHGIRPPPELTYSTPSCRIRRAAVAASPSDPPAAAPASRQIFGVLVPSKHEAAPGTAEALATGAAAGAAMPSEASLSEAPEGTRREAAGAERPGSSEARLAGCRGPRHLTREDKR